VAELRRHPLSGDWVVICPETNGAPDGAGACIYCPGREAETGKEIYRLREESDPGGSGWRMRVVAGSPPIFHVEGDFGRQGVGMCDRMEAVGAHEVLVASPAHGAGIEDLDDHGVLEVLDAIRRRAADLANDLRLKHFLAFTVRAIDGGGPAPHPVWNLISAPFVPNAIKQELNAARKYYAFKERCVFCDYLLQERRAGSRVIRQDSRMIALSPYAARVPYQAWVLPLRHSSDFADADYDELRSLAVVLRGLARAIRALPGVRGYALSIHTAPFRRPKAEAWKTIEQDYHWHVEIEPRMAAECAAESGGFHLNPVSPEEAARVLSDLA